ncbi:MAG: hypothetical protein ACK5NT_13535 [Pyrinomonadaceae bacterium]
MAKEKAGLSKRTTVLLWCLGIGIIIGVLIYFEQIPLLYVIATVALVALLLIVAFADLEGVDKDRSNDPA